MFGHCAPSAVGKAAAKLVGSLAICAIAVLTSTGAGARVSESSATNSIYSLNGQSGTGDSVTLPGLSYVVTLSGNGGFDFRHDLSCAGACSASASTWIYDTLTNDGSSAVDLSFGSLISAGRIGFGGTSGSARFAFTVAQDGNSIYSAFGTFDAAGAAIQTSDGQAFSGLSAYTLDGVSYLGWDDTTFGFSLGNLGAGQSTLLSFALSTAVDSFATGGAVVSFRDPRSGGGVSPIPEPGSWALMILGFGVSGFVLRRRAYGPALA